jgi:hypothetical protein
MMNGSKPRDAARRRRTLASSALLAVLLVAIVGLPAGARAQDTTQRKAAAETLFFEGTKLLHEQNYEAACRRFEQSQALDPGVGTLLYLGECYDRQGKTASAWATYREAESAANAAGQAERMQVAAERASRLEPRLARLVVQVAAENPRDGFELAINGKRIDAAVFGVAFPVDPGRYQIVARAPGRTPWSSTIEVQPTQQAVAQVPVLEVARGVLALPEAEPYGSSAAQTGAGGVAEASGALSPRQRAAVVVGVGGATALAAGLVMGLVAKNKDEEAQRDCVGERCSTTDAAALNESARSWATGANVAFVVGGLALAAGGVLYFWPAKKSAPTARGLPLDISAQLGPRGGLLTLGGVL